MKVTEGGAQALRISYSRYNASEMAGLDPFLVWCK